MRRWDEMCSSYRINEENIEVVDETQVKVDLEPAIKVKEVPLSSHGNHHNTLFEMKTVA